MDGEMTKIHILGDAQVTVDSSLTESAVAQKIDLTVKSRTEHVLVS
jgi:hypothetical protein